MHEVEQYTRRYQQQLRQLPALHLGLDVLRQHVEIRLLLGALPATVSELATDWACLLGASRSRRVELLSHHILALVPALGEDTIQCDVAMSDSRRQKHAATILTANPHQYNIKPACAH
jgi:hypothetical protein